LIGVEVPESGNIGRVMLRSSASPGVCDSERLPEKEKQPFKVRIQEF